MSYLLSKSRKDHPEKNGEVQKITPQTANWEYVGFEMYHLQKDQELSFDTENTETCFVLVAGKATVTTAQATFEHIGNRASPFERVPPYSVYVPHQQQVQIKAESYLELAVCRAPSQGNLPVRLIEPKDVGVEKRGYGNNKRLVHNILPETETADALLVVEVFTDEGNTSSFPSHKLSNRNLFGRNLLPPFLAIARFCITTGLH